MHKLIAVLSVAMLFPLALMAESSEVSKIGQASEVLTQIMSIPEQAIPPYLLSNAHGIAVIPAVLKAGFFLGGRRGKGILTLLRDDGSWSMPVFITLTGGSIGYQIGAQSIDIILVFKSVKSVAAMRKGKFTLGADASVAAGPVGRHAEADTDVFLQAEIYSYSRTRGLFAGVAVEGAALQIDDAATRSFYGNAKNADDIFTGKEIKAPDAAKNFLEVLKKYVPPREKP